MNEDAFERAAARSEQLEATDRWRLAGKMVAYMLGGAIVGMAAVVLLLDSVPLAAVVPGLAAMLVAAVVTGVLVGTGRVEPSPMWRSSQVDGLRVQWAVMTGRAVRRRELAGLAVSTAQSMHRLRRVVVIQGVATTTVLILPGLLAAKVVFALAFAMTLSMALNARRAEAANRALLEA